MKGKRFYSVPYDARHTHEMKKLRRKCGGIVAFGQWQALLGILYEQDGVLDLSDEVERKVTEAELELKGEKLDEFIEALTEAGWVDLTLWKTSQHVVSKGVADQLSYKKEQSSAGRKGGRSRKNSEEGGEPGEG